MFRGVCPGSFCPVTTELNVTNSSCDISFQSQEFDQDGRFHFVGFKAWRNWPTLLAKHYCLFLCH